MKKPYLTKNIYKDIDDVEVLDALLKDIGTVTLFRVGIISADDVVGVHGMIDGKYYSGTTLVLTPVSVHYDKWGLPFYRLQRYTPPSRQTEYGKYKNPRLSWDGC